MNKKDAITKARAGINAGDLRAVLNSQTYIIGMSKVNKAIPKSKAWSIFHAAIANIESDTIVDTDIAVNILREFAPDEPKEVKQFCDVNSVPF